MSQGRGTDGAGGFTKLADDDRDRRPVGRALDPIREGTSNGSEQHLALGDESTRDDDERGIQDVDEPYEPSATWPA